MQHHNYWMEVNISRHHAHHAKEKRGCGWCENGTTTLKGHPASRGGKWG